MAISGNDTMQDKAKRWYKAELDVSEDSKDILEKYSGIPPDQVQSHVHAIRDKAWAIHPYPCVGQGMFLEAAVSQHALYPEILSRMKTGTEIFLDLGCAFGQDIRKLVADGVDSKNCFGSELLPDFVDLGYDLFKDKDKLQSKFFVADVFDENSQLNELYGKVDIMAANAFFHLFSWAKQKQIAHRIAKLLRPQKDSLLVARQLGSKNPGEVQRWSTDGTAYRHSLETLGKFWDEVGEEAGAKFKVDGFEHNVDDMRNKAAEADLTWMEFSVRRLS